MLAPNGTVRAQVATLTASPCPGGHWLGGTRCEPCAPCANDSVLLTPCTSAADTVCRPCPLGWHPDPNATRCLPAPFPDSPQAPLILVALVLAELVLLATWYVWWRRYREYRALRGGQ